MENEKVTIFYDMVNNKLGDDIGILPVTLFKGMIITMHGYDNKKFEVVDWSYHHGHPDEDAGLRIYLKEQL